jgi:hypothetical protein
MADLLSLSGYDGIEIYNTVIEELDGSPLSTAKWDRLLVKGRRVLGIVNQDFHELHHARDCFNVVRTAGLLPREAISALKSGNFYCFKGVEIDEVGRDGRKLYVRTKNARLIKFIGNGGTVFKRVRGAEAEMEMTDDQNYVRIECLAEADEISWTQPFFRE